MEARPWRERVSLEEELLEQLQRQVSEAATRRADALAEGVAELGSVYKVAKALNKGWTTVDQAIKKHGSARTDPEKTA
ncbi:hypothetical protein [Streptomyces sp. 8L]|uniref:hypothetical protein n=1 Tax=Streptomyces sp. 8L TaxID=2877242 RepID=UPI001CD4411E|nr:hypothetical protein [Streptomyces sp. 8L]MCA1218675.1 hypothetical protein [Streptomyces sp. 8L]